MAMKTTLRHDGNSIYVTMEGHLDYEFTDTLRERLEKLFSEVGGKQVIFDLGGLHFVGSSGISAFIQALREFNTRPGLKPQYINVRNEFRKLFLAFDDNASFDIRTLLN